MIVCKQICVLYCAVGLWLWCVMAAGLGVSRHWIASRSFAVYDVADRVGKVEKTSRHDSSTLRVVTNVSRW